MSGKLYVVGTPIGNLEDITYRAVRILSEVDFICAEDTRVTVKLLNHFEIKKPLLSYHEHSAAHVSENIIGRLQSGESCAVVTDAGMPCISDPGEDLVRKCRDLDIPVESVPGPTAMATAAAVCGIPASRFAFEGFLSVTKKQRFDHLKSVAADTHTLIFYEAPHKLRATLEDMLKYFGDRRISICRELTKKYETAYRTTFREALEHYQVEEPKGECVIVIEGKPLEQLRKEQISRWEEMEIQEHMSYYTDQGMDRKEAMKAVAKDRGITKRDVYQQLL